MSAPHRPLRVALAAGPDLPVPPVHYGGVERVVAMLAAELVARGHDVTVFARAGSRPAGRLVPYPDSGAGPASLLRQMHVVTRAAGRGRFDVVHSFGRLAALLPILPLAMPKVVSYQRAITPRSVRLGRRLARGTLRWTACSRAQVRPVEALAPWHVIPNGVPVEAFVPVTSVPSDAPLVFLGRVERIKGAHTAIEVARRAGRRLVIAGTIPARHEAYFAAEVAPHLGGGSVAFAGPVDDGAKAALLAGAAALLMPVEWDEPFGIVMAEALACGTPVVGLDRGAVSEVVDDGVTGFVCRTADEMTAAIGRLDRLDRSACRLAAERRFSAGAVTDQYETVYRSASARGRAAAA